MFFRSAKMLSRGGILSLILGLFLIVSVQAQESTDIATEIETLMDNVAATGFSGAVLVAQDGEIIFEKAYGYANREWDIENTVDTRFRIGSVTKQFTGMAILRLHEEGALDVDDLICDYLDDCPDHWQQITIYQLLTHTSGIPNYTSFPDFLDVMVQNSESDDFVAYFHDEPLDFEPGSYWNYSNSGYHLLGLIIEEASGLSYHVFLRRTFFNPLGMENTGYEFNDSVIENRAYGYNSLVTRSEYINMNIPYAAGSLYSTNHDLLIWNQALHNGEVVSQDAWDEMWEREIETGNVLYYSYGLFRIPLANGDMVIGHNGGIPGFISNNDHFVDANIDIIIWTNMPGLQIQILPGQLRNLFVES